MSHANAALTPRQRLRIARLIVDEHGPVAHAAVFFHVAWPTAKRWAERYRAMGAAGMGDRSSRPHRSPTRTNRQTVKKIVGLRWRHRLGPVAIGAALGVPASTVHAVLVRAKVNRLHHIDIRTGEVVRRYEHDKPGALIHVDAEVVGQHPRRRRLALRRPRPGQSQPAAHAGDRSVGQPQAVAGRRVRAHRDR